MLMRATLIRHYGERISLIHVDPTELQTDGGAGANDQMAERTFKSKPIPRYLKTACRKGRCIARKGGMVFGMVSVRLPPKTVLSMSD
jgi:hypothetical protein